MISAQIVVKGRKFGRIDMTLSPAIHTRLQFQHETILVLTRDLPEEHLKRELVPGKWSILDNIAHLTRYQHVFTERLNIILREQEPAFKQYVAPNDPLFRLYQARSLDELWEDLVAIRSDIQQILTGLDPVSLSRRGLHPVYGALTLTDWTEFFLLHEAHHLLTIFKMVPALRAN